MFEHFYMCTKKYVSLVGNDFQLKFTVAIFDETNEKREREREQKIISNINSSSSFYILSLASTLRQYLHFTDP